MSESPSSPVTAVAGQLLVNLFLLAVGSALCAVAINGILIPQQFVSAGLTGIALLVHYLVPDLPVAGLYLVFNIPLFLLGWLHVGRRFFWYSLAGTLLFTVAVAVLHFPIPVEDKILAALLAGILTGLGSGAILRSLGSAGGVDILSVMLFRRFSIRLGSTTLAFNVAVLTAALLLFTLDSVLYTLVFIFVSSRVVNLVVTGLSQRKAVMVVSREWQTIQQAICSELNRGVTILEGRGAYSGQEERILYSVITFQELARLKRLIKTVDPEAFVVVTDTLEVIGQRIGNQPHW